MPLGAGSQHSLTQAMVRSTPVSSQKAWTNEDTLTSGVCPAGHSHFHLHAASPTHCSVQEWATNQSGFPTPSATSSLVMNCPMLRTVRVGRQVSHPRTLILHLHAARRCLASDEAAPSVPTVSGMTNSYQGTLSSEMPWTAS